MGIQCGRNCTKNRGATDLRGNGTQVLNGLWKNADDLGSLEQSKPRGIMYGKVPVEKKTAGGSEASARGGEKSQTRVGAGDHQSLSPLPAQFHR